MSVPRLLVAEDSPTQAEALKLLLESEGFAVTLAPDGRVAWELLRSERFDAVLLDVTMPGMDGRELCRAVRRDARTRHVALFVVTGVNDPAALLGAIELDIDAWLLKPVDIDALIERLRPAIERSRKRQRRDELVRELPQRVEAIREKAPDAVGLLEALTRELLALDE